MWKVSPARTVEFEPKLTNFSQNILKIFRVPNETMFLLHISRHFWKKGLEIGETTFLLTFLLCLDTKVIISKALITFLPSWAPQAQIRKARREKFTRRNCTIPIIHLGQAGRRLPLAWWCEAKPKSEVATSLSASLTSHVEQSPTLGTKFFGTLPWSS